MKAIIFSLFMLLIFLGLTATKDYAYITDETASHVESQPNNELFKETMQSLDVLKVLFLKKLFIVIIKNDEYLFLLLKIIILKLIKKKEWNCRRKKISILFILICFSFHKTIERLFSQLLLLFYTWEISSFLLLVKTTKLSLQILKLWLKFQIY